MTTPIEGYGTIQPAGEFRSAGRRYRGETLVLETEFETDSRAVRASFLQAFTHIGLVETAFTFTRSSAAPTAA